MKSKERRGEHVKRDDFEIRSAAFSVVDDRAGETGDAPGLVIEGYAVVFDSPAEIGDIHNGGFIEEIAPTAFDGIDLMRADVPLKVEHGESPIILARTRNKSLQLSTDAHGLKIRAQLLKCEAAWIERIRSGLYSSMSFAFSVDRDGEEISQHDGVMHRRITKFSRLWDVSIVAVPAYGSTEICARSAQRAQEWAAERHAARIAAMVARWA